MRISEFFASRVHRDRHSQAQRREATASQPLTCSATRSHAPISRCADNRRCANCDAENRCVAYAGRSCSVVGWPLQPPPSRTSTATFSRPPERLADFPRVQVRPRQCVHAIPHLRVLPLQERPPGVQPPREGEIVRCRFRIVCPVRRAAAARASDGIGVALRIRALREGNTLPAAARAAHALPWC
jgi:hypothetical protein